MKPVTLLMFALCCLVCSGAYAQEEPSAEDMKAMLEKAQQFTQPGPHHEFLEKFLGTWDVEFLITMKGMEGPPEQGTATFDWLFEGRWLKQELSGTFMGMPIEGFSTMGYDNFKQSYVVTSVSTWDTAMQYAEGDLDPHGNVLLMYGTLDEYLTGEHDKMVKTVWRLVSEDEMIFEIHDLPIGEENTKVLQWTYRRKA